MNNFINKEILEYSEKYSQQEPEILQELNRETHLKILNPRMLSGFFQGRLLSIISKLIKPKKVLEIGTGSGYQAAVLTLLDTHVYTIERQKDLFNKTKQFLPTIGYDCMFIYGDGYKGLPKFAPFDRIIITCGAPFIPKELINQLKIGGKMVVPVGDGDNQEMHLVEKISETETKVTTHGNFSFVPMLNDKENGN